MSDTEKLLALEELRILKARYFRFVDGKRWSEWGALFEPNVLARFHHAGQIMEFKGREALVDTVSRFLQPALTIHHGHTPELELLSPTAASGNWVMQDWLYWPEGTHPDGVRCILGWGHYEETYCKASGAWRIATLTLTRSRLLIDPRGDGESLVT